MTLFNFYILASVKLHCSSKESILCQGLEASDSSYNNRHISPVALTRTRDIELFVTNLTTRKTMGITVE